MRFGIITIFPEMFASLHYGILGRALRSGALSVEFWNPRDYTHDRHRTVDDRPYGGGPGMVMKAPPLADAVHAAHLVMPNAPVIYLSPQGQLLNQAILAELAQQTALILIAGRYEGVDERFVESSVDRELSIGDYVISGGELAVMVIIDGISRLLPGVLGHPASANQDSFVTGLLDYPHYTRPRVYAERPVPNVLISGNHEAIHNWRFMQSVRRTRQRRPDLFVKLSLTEEQLSLLENI